MRIIHALAVMPLLALAAVAAPRAAAAQQARPTATLTIGGKSYAAAGNGICQSAPVASIYGVRASMWSVQLDGGAGGGLRSLSLTVWRPVAGGGEQMSLYAKTGATEHRIDTVKKGGRGGIVGAGTVTVRPQGPGGRFEIDGRDGSGATVRGTVTCPRFSSMEAVGG
ncbi:MAG TPA: hypothetical protein VFJ74_04160 [Gemmatimonadaceae bacterium]|nr:hypothetical protein [Gemmatimonadaceae bacterium]